MPRSKAASRALIALALVSSIAVLAGCADRARLEAGPAGRARGVAAERLSGLRGPKKDRIVVAESRLLHPTGPEWPELVKVDTSSFMPATPFESLELTEIAADRDELDALAAELAGKLRPEPRLEIRLETEMIKVGEKLVGGPEAGWLEFASDDGRWPISVYKVKAERAVHEGHVRTLYVISCRSGRLTVWAAAVLAEEPFADRFPVTLVTYSFEERPTLVKRIDRPAIVADSEEVLRRRGMTQYAGDVWVRFTPGKPAPTDP